MMLVRAERHHRRDEWISARHRAWGIDCPGCDLDFVEFDRGEPVGLVEYKHWRSPPVDLDHPTMRALNCLATYFKPPHSCFVGIPFLIATYWPASASFRITPVNAPALIYFEDGEQLSERDYVGRLYSLRDRVMPEALAARLGDVFAAVQGQGDW